MRECHRVLRHGGRIGGYVIHAPVDLDEAAARRVTELAAMDVIAAGSPRSLTREAGFEAIEIRDVTGRFRATCQAFVDARSRFEVDLRDADGDEVYETEQNKKIAVLTAIDEGLLLRSMVAAVKP